MSQRVSLTDEEVVAVADILDGVDYEVGDPDSEGFWVPLIAKFERRRQALRDKYGSDYAAGRWKKA